MNSTACIWLHAWYISNTLFELQAGADGNLEMAKISGAATPILFSRLAPSQSKHKHVTIDSLSCLYYHIQSLFTTENCKQPTPVLVTFASTLILSLGCISKAVILAR